MIRSRCCSVSDFFRRRVDAGTAPNRSFALICCWLPLPILRQPSPRLGNVTTPLDVRGRLRDLALIGGAATGGLPVPWRQTRRCLCVLRRRYQVQGTAPVLLKRRQFGEQAHPYGHVHRQHRAPPRHGWRTEGQGSARDGADGIHYAKQWRLDHFRRTKLYARWSKLIAPATPVVKEGRNISGDAQTACPNPPADLFVACQRQFLRLQRPFPQIAS
jgi:hypothetical protein